MSQPTNNNILTWYVLFFPQVDYVDTSQNTVNLKLIPRIDYTKMRGTLKSHTDDKRKRTRRPPQKLFDIDAVKAIGG